MCKFHGLSLYMFVFQFLKTYEHMIYLNITDPRREDWPQTSPVSQREVQASKARPGRTVAGLPRFLFHLKFGSTEIFEHETNQFVLLEGSPSEANMVKCCLQDWARPGFPWFRQGDWEFHFCRDLPGVTVC